jgi:hypothetical protein
MRNFNRFIVVIPTALAACAGGEGEEDLALHACEQIGEAGETVAAAATLEEAAQAEIEPSEAPFTVALVDGGGFVNVHIHEETDALLFVDVADVVSGLYLDGEAQSLATPGPNEDCPEDIPEHWDLELTEGEWTLEFGPSALDEIWLMLLSGGHDHHE